MAGDRDSRADVREVPDVGIVADSRAPRNGAFVEELGYYNPGTEPAELKVDNEKAAAWMKNGAQPTDTVRALLKKSGAIE